MVEKVLGKLCPVILLIFIRWVPTEERKQNITLVRRLRPYKVCLGQKSVSGPSRMVGRPSGLRQWGL